MEEQELALENDMLFEEFSSRLTDVRSLQSRVSEIARLQQTFTENVISQVGRALHSVATVFYIFSIAVH